MIITPNNKKIHFGAKGYKDFIIYNTIDKQLALKKKHNYINRHKINEDWNNKNSPGFWSKWLLWYKPTLRQSINATQKKFNIKISFK